MLKSLKSLNGLISAVAIVLSAAAPTVSATPDPNTWVSSGGVDSGSCTRANPCATFAFALSASPAGGEIDCVDAGSYGVLTIAKSITIDCGAQAGGVWNTSGNGITINSSSAIVVLRNLTIAGAGTGTNGISITDAASVTLDNVSIRGQSASGVSFTPALASKLIVRNSSVQGSGTFGILSQPSAALSPPAAVTVSDSTFAGNGLAGMKVRSSSWATVVNSLFLGNLTNGVISENIGAGLAPTLYLERVVCSGNDVGAYANGGKIYMSNTVITNNASFGLRFNRGGNIYQQNTGNVCIGNGISNYCSSPV